MDTSIQGRFQSTREKIGTTVDQKLPMTIVNQTQVSQELFMAAFQL